jgi:hypothetical protein
VIILMIKNMVTGCGPDSFAWSGEECVHDNGRIGLVVNGGLPGVVV